MQKDLDQDRYIAHDDRVRKVTFLSKHKLLLTNTVNGTINIWNIGQKSLPIQVTSPNKKMSYMVSAQDEKFVALAAENGVILIVDPFSGDEIAKFEDPEMRVSDLTIRPNSSELIILTHQTILSWSYPFQNDPVNFANNLDHGRCIKNSPDQRYLAMGTNNGEIHLRKWSDQEPIAKLSLKKKSSIRTLSFNPFTDQIAFTTDDKVVYIWNFRNHEVKSLTGHRHWVWTLAYSPDGKWLVTGGWDRQIRLWDSQNHNFAAAFVANNPIGEIQFDVQDSIIWAADIARETYVYELEIIEG